MPDTILEPTLSINLVLTFRSTIFTILKITEDMIFTSNTSIVVLASATVINLYRCILIFMCLFSISGEKKYKKHYYRDDRRNNFTKFV